MRVLLFLHHAGVTMLKTAGDAFRSVVLSIVLWRLNVYGTITARFRLLFDGNRCKQWLYKSTPSKGVRKGGGWG